MLATVAGCDYGHREHEPVVGPPLHIVATHPADGAGIDCPSSEATCGVPIDTTVELRFDRFLLPPTAVRQSIIFYTGRGLNSPLRDPRLPEILPSYDPLERVVRFTLPEGATLQHDALFTVEFPVAGAISIPPRHVPYAPWGFRAVDGAPLDEQGILRISFRTGSSVARRDEPEVPDCDDIRDIFRCGSPGCVEGSGCTSCHSREVEAPHGLRLETRDDLVETAIGQLARQTAIGGSLQTFEAPPRFAAQMPIIDPGRPDNSYLLYKILLGARAYEAGPLDDEGCESDYEVSVPGEDAGRTCLSPDTAELERLREFVLGDPMPPPGSPPLGKGAVRSLIRWIRAGATCP